MAVQIRLAGTKTTSKQKSVFLSREKFSVTLLKGKAVIKMALKSKIE